MRTDEANMLLNIICWISQWLYTSVLCFVCVTITSHHLLDLRRQVLYLVHVINLNVFQKIVISKDNVLSTCQIDLHWHVFKKVAKLVKLSSNWRNIFRHLIEILFLDYNWTYQSEKVLLNYCSLFELSSVKVHLPTVNHSLTFLGLVKVVKNLLHPVNDQPFLSHSLK